MTNSRARGTGLRASMVSWWQFGPEAVVELGIGSCGAGKGRVEGRSYLRRREERMRWSGFDLGRVGQRRRRSAGYDSFPPLAPGLPSLSGGLMKQERRRCWWKKHLHRDYQLRYICLKALAHLARARW